MTDEEIQAWFRKVDLQANADVLAIGLLAADDESKDRVFRNMSERASKALAKEIEKNKKMNLSEKVLATNTDILEKLIGGQRS